MGDASTRRVPDNQKQRGLLGRMSIIYGDRVEKEIKAEGESKQRILRGSEIKETRKRRGITKKEAKEKDSSKELCEEKKKDSGVCVCVERERREREKRERERERDQ